jgi:hypothetical protein
MQNKLETFSYSAIVQSLISRKYSIQDEIAIIRQMSAKPEEYEEYYNYCESCKEEAKQYTN